MYIFANDSIFMCVYMNIHTYVYINIYILPIYMCVYTHTHLCTYVHTYILCISLYVYGQYRCRGALFAVINPCPAQGIHLVHSNKKFTATDWGVRTKKKLSVKMHLAYQNAREEKVWAGAAACLCPPETARAGATLAGRLGAEIWIAS